MDTVVNTFSVEVDKIDRDAWEQQLDKFDDACLYTTWAYGAVRWGEKNLSHVVLKKDDEIISMSQARIAKLPFTNTGIAYITRGPLWQLRGKKRDEDVFRIMIQALHREYCVNRGLYLRIAPNIFNDGSCIFSSILNNNKYMLNEKIHRYRTLLLDLTPDSEDLRKNLKQKWRGHLNKATRMDFNIVEGTDDELFKTFKGIYEQMHTRKKFVEYVDIDEYREIQKKLPDNLKLRIMLSELSGEPVSGLVWTAMGNTGIAIFSATTDDGMKYDGSYLLRWDMVLKLKERGFVFLDQGGINPKGNPGSYNFKSGMGGTDIELIGQYDASASTLNSLLIKTGDLLRTHYRKSLVKIKKIHT